MLMNVTTRLLRRPSLRLTLTVVLLSGSSLLFAQAVAPKILPPGTPAKASAPTSEPAPVRWQSTGTRPAVSIGERSSVWLNLQPGQTRATTFVGTNSAILNLQSGAAEPTAQIAVDFNADGYADLVSAFRAASGSGLIALHRANREAFQPKDAQVLANLRRGIFPVSFEAEATVLSVPAAPDFIFAGKFSKDSTVDLVFATRGGRSLYLMTSDRQGGFNAPKEIPVEGAITALASDQLDASKAYAGLVVAVRDGGSSTLLVFDGADELQKISPQKVSMNGEVSSLILANPGGSAQGRDAFVLADGAIFSVRRIGSPGAAVERVALPFNAIDIAVGEFIRDREARAEIAVLSHDGSVSYLTRGRLDTRPFTPNEVLETWSRKGGRGRSASASETATSDSSDAWLVAESHQVGASARRLQKAYLTGNETEDLLVTDAQSDRVRVLFKEPSVGNDRASFTGETKVQDVALGAAPAAVLPMRLNVMGQQGFVFFARGNVEPIPVVMAPNATFVGYQNSRHKRRRMQCRLQFA